LCRDFLEWHARCCDDWKKLESTPADLLMKKVNPEFEFSRTHQKQWSYLFTQQPSKEGQSNG
jgi:hypothetical protein